MELFDNTIVGFEAGNRTTRGQNSFFGSRSGLRNLTGQYNSFFGALSGMNINSALGNSFFGYQSGENHFISDFNSYFGYRSGQRSIDGTQNSFFGYVAGRNNTIGNRNSYFGAQAGELGLAGEYNCYFGYQAGHNAFGDNNICIGPGAGPSFGSPGSIADGQLYIDGLGTPDPFIYGEFANGYLEINASLHVRDELNIRTAPTNNPEPGHFYSNSGPLAYGYVGSNAVLLTDYGVTAVIYLGRGTYRIILDNDFSINPVVLITPSSDNADQYTATYEAHFDNRIRVRIFNSAGTPSDRAFSFQE